MLAAAYLTCLTLTLPAEPAVPIVLVGVDGMTFDLVDPLVAQGKLPTLAGMLAGGARAELVSERPMRSPALWTTVATGQPRSVHGIYDFVTGSRYWPQAQPEGPPKLVTSGMRRAPALWQLAAQGDHSSLVVGWLNTWPAEAIHGVMIAPYVALGDPQQTSIKGRVYPDAGRQTHPADAFARLRQLVMASEAVPASLIARIVEEPPPHSPLFSDVPHLRRYLYTVRWSLASGLTNAALVTHELERRRFDLVMTYFDGADTLGHRFWLFSESLPRIREGLAQAGVDPRHAEEMKARFGRAVEGYYEVVDGWLRELKAAAGPEATLVVVSDHGWGSARGGRRDANVPFDGEHRLDGVFIAQGPHVKPGRVGALTLYDVAPTILYLLGSGVPAELKGKVALDLVTPSFAASHPPLLIAGKKPAVRQSPQPEPDAHFSEVEINRLRSLGYVQ